MIQYFLYRIAQFLVTSLPLGASYWIADRLADLHFSFSVKSRRQVFKNLQWIYDGVFFSNEKARTVFHNFGRYLVDFLSVTRIPREVFFKRMPIEGLEHIQGALEEGRGVVAVTAHFGNWEWGGIGLALLGYPVHAIALTHSNPAVNQFFVHQRMQKGVHVIPIQDSLRRASKLLNQNEVILMATDRDVSNHGIPISFLGRQVFFPHGPAALARRCQSPLVVGIVIREKKGFFRFVFEPPIEPEKTKDIATDLQRMTQKMASLLETYIRRFPTQWFLFQGLREVP